MAYDTLQLFNRFPITIACTCALARVAYILRVQPAEAKNKIKKRYSTAYPILTCVK